MTDYRCPKCNRPVDGAGINVQEVRIEPKPTNPPTKCKFCKVKIEMKESKDDIPHYYFYCGG